MLVSFLEVACEVANNVSDAVHLRTFHIEECLEVLMIRAGHSEPLDLLKHSSNQWWTVSKESQTGIYSGLLS